MAIVDTSRPITGGVDTHLDVHVAAAIDSVGGLLGVESFPTTPAGYHALAGWLESFGPIERVGVEGTGTYGAGLARHLAATGIALVEVDRPNRQERRRKGKSDELDAIEAAPAATRSATRPRRRSFPSLAACRPSTPRSLSWTATSTRSCAPPPPTSSTSTASAPTPPRSCSSPPATTPSASDPRRHGRTCAVWHRSRPGRARPTNATGSTLAGTARRTTPSGASC